MRIARILASQMLSAAARAAAPFGGIGTVAPIGPMAAFGGLATAVGGVGIVGGMIALRGLPTIDLVA